MVVLVTYDIMITEGKNGPKRLRRVAKVCQDYGQRVQASVFECSVDPAQYVELKRRLEKEIDSKRDNIRFYLLGKNWQRRVEVLGKVDSYDPDKDVIII